MGEPTIAAIATAHGVGSIAIVRLSGAKALEIAQKLTHATLTPRVAHLKKLFALDGSLLDEAIVLFFQGPKSFTGENVVEFQCHGGVIVASMVLDAVLAMGAVLAKAGEFSKRAFLNGRIDLTQAHAIAALIDAKSENAAKLLTRQLKGDLGRFVETLRDALLELIAYAEVTIDYAEEDLPTNLIEQMQAKLSHIASVLRETLRSSQERAVLIDGYRVAIVGRPNVGKSSLLNALLRYERAIVSDIAGTTRDTIEESMRVGTHLIRIVDTAGIRQSSDAIEQIGIARSRAAITEADIVLALFDGSMPLSSEDEALIALLHESNKPTLTLINKSDLGLHIEREKLPEDAIVLSTKNSLESLHTRLIAMMDIQGHADDTILVAKYQIEAVKTALVDIDEAKALLEESQLELFSFHLNSAVQAMASITRPIAYDEMLDKMFGNFCVGK
ncbi:MAG: tRNA modification GTPase TrmE [Sulfuricurvum sp. PC08-66]|nr:MAG: tRNA modification GTPase TrmE [Sulfuricurvum sp. PC08-66]